jgi:hypothetical protein
MTINNPIEVYEAFVEKNQKSIITYNALLPQIQSEYTELYNKLIAEKEQLFDAVIKYLAGKWDFEAKRKSEIFKLEKVKDGCVMLPCEFCNNIGGDCEACFDLGYIWDKKQQISPLKVIQGNNAWFLGRTKQDRLMSERSNYFTTFAAANKSLLKYQKEQKLKSTLTKALMVVCDNKTFGITLPEILIRKIKAKLNEIYPANF